VSYYNNQRDYESLQNSTPADVYFGRQESILKQRENLKNCEKTKEVPQFANA